jgi:hypothetical protein
VDRVLDVVHQFADDLEYATRRKKRLDREQLERGVRSVLGIGSAVVTLLGVFFPSARVVTQANKIMSLAHEATDALSVTPKLEESQQDPEHHTTPSQQHTN